MQVFQDAANLLHDRICDPEIELCDSIRDMAEENTPEQEKAALYWGLMALVLWFCSGQVGALGGGGLTTWTLSSIGWNLLFIYNSLAWTPNFIFWLLHMIKKDSESFTYYFVLFSNLTLLGPIFIWWLTLALAIISWIIGGLGNLVWSIVYLIEIFVVYVIGAYFMHAYIGGVRALYKGDKDTLQSWVG